MVEAEERFSPEQVQKNLIVRLERGLVRIYNSKSKTFANAEAGRLLKAIIEWREKLKE